GFFYESTHLAELLKTVASRPNRVALLVAGRGHDQPLVAEYARHNSNVIFLGWLDEDEMRALYRSVDIGFQPLNPAENVNWRYFGSTNKLFESLAAGCLFVGSAINERVEMNREAEFAVEIDFRRDVSAQLGDLLDEVVSDPARLRRMQANAR